MSKPKNQHWVPRFYLRGFSTPETRHSGDPQVWIFSKNERDGNEQLTNVKKVCAKRYLYSPRDKRGQRSWEIEDKLEGVESLVAAIWPQVSSDFVDLSSELIRKVLALFVATTHVRNLDNRNSQKSLHADLVQALDRLPKKPDGSPNIDSFEYKGKEFPFDTSGWESYKTWSEDEHHRFFAETIRTESGYLAELLLKKRWSVVLSESEQFITSDSPVSVTHASREIFGMGTAGSIVSFPISPTRILIMDDNHQEPANQYYQLKPGSVGAFNYGIWHAGMRFMVTGRPVPEVLSEIVGWADQQKHA